MNLFNEKNVTVIGADTQDGTAMAYIAASAGHRVILYGDDLNLAENINHSRQNPICLTEFKLPDNIIASNDLMYALRTAEIIIFSIANNLMLQIIKEYKYLINSNCIICNTSKGFDHNSKQLVSHSFKIIMGIDQPYVIISGPSMAREIMERHPTAVIAASEFLYNAIAIQSYFSSNIFRIYTSQGF